MCEQWALASGAPRPTQSGGGGMVSPSFLYAMAIPAKVTSSIERPMADSEGLSGSLGCSLGCRNSGHLCRGGAEEVLSAPTPPMGSRAEFDVGFLFHRLSTPARGALRFPQGIASGRFSRPRCVAHGDSTLGSGQNPSTLPRLCHHTGGQV